MTIDIKAIRARAEAATRGPWRSVDCFEGPKCWCAVVDSGPDDDRGIVPSGSCSRRDAEFIAAARTDVPALCDEVERLTEERDEARAALSELRANDAAVIESAERERDEARAEVERVTAQRDQLAPRCIEYHNENVALRAEVERWSKAYDDTLKRWIDDQESSQKRNERIRAKDRAELAEARAEIERLKAALRDAAKIIEAHAGLAVTAGAFRKLAGEP